MSGRPWVRMFLAARFALDHRKGLSPPVDYEGPPVRRPLFRLNRPDTEWIEKAIAEDMKRGQLEKGTSDWSFPAFPTKEAKAYKAIKRQADGG